MKFLTYTKLFSTLAGTAALAASSGCGGGGAISPRVSPTPDPAHIIYVAEPNASGSSSYATTILEFDASSTGTTAPIATLIVDPNLGPFGMSVDRSGQVYLSCDQNFPAPPEILVYAAGASGSATPLRTIFPSVPSGALIGKVVVDSAGLIYIPVSSSSTILVYAANANGAAAPIRTIQWDPTQFNGGGDIAVDGNGYVYVAGFIPDTAQTNPGAGEIEVFSPETNGATSPDHVISGSNTLLSPGIPRLTVDLAGNIYAVMRNSTQNATAIVEFAANASGNATPTNILTGNFGTSGLGAVQTQVDNNGNLYVLGSVVAPPPLNPIGPPTPTPGPSTVFVAVFPITATDNATPLTQFTAASMTNPGPAFTVR